MKTLSNFVKRQPVGKTFPLTAPDVGMSPSEFDDFAKKLSCEGGGDGFSVSSMQTETLTPMRLVYIVFATRIPLDDD